MRAARPWNLIGAVVLTLCCSSGIVAAQQTQTVSGIIVNFGIVPAEVALRADGHADSHPANLPHGSQHLLITLDDEKTHQRIADAEVLVEVTDPRGHVETKPMLDTQSRGLADYSELFLFSWSGDYTIRAAVTRTPPLQSFRTRFTVHHQI
jgi:hypothetical protein